MRRLLAIANPISGRGRAVKLLPRLAQLAEASGTRIETNLTESAGHATELARGAAGQGYDAVIAAGGDGTINEIINGLGPNGLPLMVAPLGTGNVLAKELRATRDLQRYAAALRDWRTSARDLGRLADGRLFACFVGAGFDGQCTKALAERKGRMRMSQYVPIMLKAVRASDFTTIKVTPDGNEPLTSASYSLVAITPGYGGPLVLAPGAVPNNGHFEVLTIHKRIRLFSATGLVMRAIFGRMARAKGARFTACERVEITADEQVPVQVDGDFAGYLPVRCEILPGALRVFRPE